MSNSEASSCWRTHEYPGYFRLDLPALATTHLEEAESVLRIELPVQPRTELFVGVFPLSDDGRGLQEALKSQAARFFRECVGTTRFSVTVPHEFDAEGYYACQAVAEYPADRWWIVRLYCRQGGGSLLMMHWSGPETQIHEFVLPVFVSVTPLL